MLKKRGVFRVFFIFRGYCFVHFLFAYLFCTFRNTGKFRRIVSAIVSNCLGSFLYYVAGFGRAFGKTKSFIKGWNVGLF